MYFVYVLRSLKDFNNYVGLTTDLTRRIRDHNYGKVGSTKSRGPFELIYFEEYDNKNLAEKRERFFKSGKGYEVLKGLLKKPPTSPTKALGD